MAKLKEETNVVFEAVVRIKLPQNHGRLNCEDDGTIVGARGVNDYVRDAVENWGGSFFPGNPLFRLEVTSCVTKKLKSDQTPKKAVDAERLVAAAAKRQSRRRLTNAVKSIKNAPAKAEAKAETKSSIPLKGWSDAVKRNRKKLQQLSD